jgi:hypothetical protein
VKPDQVYITEYPNPTRDARGRFVGLQESLEGQGDIYGTLHPNVKAHGAIAGLVVAALEKHGITGKPR